MELNFIERIKRINNLYNTIDDFYNDYIFNDILVYDNIEIKLTKYQEKITKYYLGSDNNSFYLNHSTGSGKTILSAGIINNLKTIYPDWEILILCKKSIFDQWEKALQFNNSTVITQLYNYKNNKNLINILTTFSKIKSSNRVLLIIDEIHNITSSMYSSNSDEYTLSKEIYDAIHTFCKDFQPKLLCLSATPIVNNPEEFLYICKLLKYNITFPKNLFRGTDFIYKKNILSTMIGAFSTYITTSNDIFENVPVSELYPARNVFIEKIQIPNSHLEIYKKSQIHNRDKFKIIHKIILNLNDENIIRETIRNDKGYSISMKNKIANIKDDALLKELSVKFYRTVELILASKGKCIVYCKYLNLGGITTLAGYMENKNIKYDILTSETKNRDIILERFNDNNNLYGENLKVILFSDIASEGVNFFAVETQILLSIPWNETGYIQILGRSFRQGRHNVKPLNERYINIYILIGIHQEIQTNDAYMLDFIFDKREKIKQIKEIIETVSLEHCLEVANGNISDFELGDFYIGGIDNFKLEKKKAIIYKYKSKNYNGFLSDTGIIYNHNMIVQSSLDLLKTITPHNNIMIYEL